ncbi:tetratricopeptide repeat protein [Bernardetia sp.]|uniref:tetratricopeptide repeat protein n=1 Tax=Bernardetia sp. TaxID=1937974 RepID=UPI0025B9D4AF|nr:tetratricopeptide repeat protein [Bernardetia sp.]
MFLFFCVLTFSQAFGQELSSYYDSARVYESKDLERQSFFTKKLIQESLKQKNDSFLLKGYEIKSVIFYRQGNADSAFAYIDKTIRLSEKTDDHTVRIDMLRLKSFVYKNRLNNKDSAMLYLKIALEESKKTNYEYGEIKSLEAISFLQMDKGKYFDAIQLLLEAREIAHRIEHKKALSTLANNIGHTYLEMEMYDKALSFFKEANRYREDKNTGSVIPLNIAQCLHKQGDDKKALFIMNKNAPLALKTSLNTAIQYYLEYVDIFLDRNEPKKALEKIAVLDSLFEKKKSKRHHSLLLLKAKTHLQLKDTLQAHSYIKEVEEHMLHQDKEEDFANRLTMHELFSHTYSFLKDYKNANYHSQQYISLYKTTYNKKLQQDIYEAEINQRIELQKKEQELEKVKYANELAKEQRNKNYFSFGLVTLFLISLIMARAYWISKKYSKKLKITNHRLSETQAEITQQNQVLHEQSEKLILQAEELRCSHEEVIAMNENLEDIVKQRNQEVLEKNKMLEEYAFINAHKLRAPVARLMGIMQIIELSKDTSEMEFYIQLCNEEIKDLNRIIWAIKEAIEEKTPLDRLELEKRTQEK